MSDKFFSIKKAKQKQSKTAPGFHTKKQVSFPIIRFNFSTCGKEA